MGSAPIGGGLPGAPWAARVALVLFVVALLLPPLAAGFLYAKLFHLPMSGSLPRFRPGIESEITRVFDATGAQIAAYRRFETTLPVEKSDIPRLLNDAVVAAEDQRFYSHKGVDPKGAFRALRRNTAVGEYVQGASTITQQYVRLAYIGERSSSLREKLREAVLARRLEDKLPKDEILFRYLSRVYFGAGAYGAGAASETYFRKPVKDLTLSEAALLAGIIPAPTRLEPRSSPGEAERRRQLVLDTMLRQGRISPSQHREAVSERLVVVDGSTRPAGPATVVYPEARSTTRFPYYADYVRRYLVAKYGEEAVYQGGLQVETALDPKLQGLAEATVAEAINGTSAPLDMALVTVDPKTGHVRALVGGRDFARSQVNLALGNCGAVREPDEDGPVCVSGGGAGRQPGSAFKPITLARAFEEGIGPDTVYRGPGTYTFPRCSGNGCTVKNVESGSYGSMTLTDATAYSVNTVYAQLVQDVEVKDTAEAAHRLGLTMINPDGKQKNGEPYGPSLTLGAAEVSPLDMAASFGVFANRGEQQPATPVVRIVDPTGKVLEDNRSRRPERVLPTLVADQVNEVLTQVVQRGTGRAADIGRPNGTAGKTGTSEDFGDAWFVGYTPQLSTAVWMGHADSRRSMENIKGVARVYGGTIPAETWKNFMTRALDGVPTVDFVRAAGLPPAPPPSISEAPATTAPPLVVEVPIPQVTIPPPQDFSPPATFAPYDGPVVTPPPRLPRDNSSFPTIPSPRFTPTTMIPTDPGSRFP
jgi:penicillin-binding protein 1A